MMMTMASWGLAYAVNALWQVPVVFAVAWVVAWAMRRVGRVAATGEHRVWVGALLAEVALPGTPSRWGELARRVPGVLVGWWRGAGDGGGVQVGFGTGAAGVFGGWKLPGGVLMGLAAAYGVSVAYFAARLGWGLWRTRGMRLRALPLDLAEQRGEALREVRGSAEVGGPVTVGAWRGVVLVPMGFLERVAGEDLAAVLAHERAHVRRRDFLKNAAYGLLTVPVGFHPAVWATRARVAESREMICDAMAAEAVAGRERYAGSLLRLAALLIEARPARLLHAIGIFGMLDAHSFERRVMNLTGNGATGSVARRAMVAMACAGLGLGTCAGAMALRVGVPVFAAGEEAPARVAGGVMAGQVLSKVNPVYPPDAKAEKISGTVVLQAVIGKDGTVENLQVVSGPEKLRTSALDAVRQWTYRPYLLNGQPVEVQTTIQVTYSFGG